MDVAVSKDGDQILKLQSAGAEWILELYKMNVITLKSLRLCFAKIQHQLEMSLNPGEQSQI